MNEKIEKLIDASLADKFKPIYDSYNEYTAASNQLKAKYEEDKALLDSKYAETIKTYDVLMLAKEAIGETISGAKNA